MDRTLLAHLPIIVAVAEMRGFAPAAASLGMSPSAVSHAVRVVEDRLGEPLFARTTRSVALTEAGRRLIGRVGPALVDIEQGCAELSEARGEVSGTLRINAARVTFSMALTAVLVRLAKEHPRLTVEAHAEDGFVDIVSGGYDAGVRLGVSVDRDMVAVRLTPPFRTALVASPAYLAERGRPDSLASLAAHSLIGFRMLASGGLYQWELTEGAREVTLRTGGAPVVSDATHARELALAGVGIAYVFEPLIRRDVASGALCEVLAESAVTEDGLFVYFPQRQKGAPKIRALVAAARAVSAALSAGDAH